MMNSHGEEARLETILGSRNGIGEIIGEILTKEENNEGGGGKDLFQASQGSCRGIEMFTGFSFR